MIDVEKELKNIKGCQYPVQYRTLKDLVRRVAAERDQAVELCVQYVSLASMAYPEKEAARRFVVSQIDKGEL